MLNWVEHEKSFTTSGPGVGIGTGFVGGVVKDLKLKIFMWWIKCWRVSYPLQGQVLLLEIVETITIFIQLQDCFYGQNNPKNLGPSCKMVLDLV